MCANHGHGEGRSPASPVLNALQSEYVSCDLVRIILGRKVLDCRREFGPDDERTRRAEMALTVVSETAGECLLAFMTERDRHIKGG